MSAWIGTQYKVASACLREIKLQGLLGSGNFGDVYEACDPACNYVLKVMSLPIEFGNDFETEVKLTKIASDIGVGPKFIDSWVCVGETSKGKPRQLGFILTEKYSDSLRSYVRKHKKIPAMIAKQIQDLIDRLHRAGMVHSDLHYGNIVIKISNDNIVDVKLIDFGLAFLVDHPPADIDDRYRHIKSGDEKPVFEAQDVKQLVAAIMLYDTVTWWI